MKLYHETGLAQFASIVSSRRIASFTNPHPAEFLLRADHANFRNIGGFRGRGVVLEFEWTGEIRIIPESMLNIKEPNILFHVFHAVDLSDGGLFTGVDGTYWHSRIYQETNENLRLVGVTVRDSAIPGADYSNLKEKWIITEDEIRDTRSAIGNGLQINVSGGPPPIYLPQNANLTSNSIRDARSSKYFQRFLRRIW